MQGHGFVELHDGEARYLWLWFEQLSDVGDAHSVAVVLDDRENRPRGHAAGNFTDVMAQVVAVDFDPRVERGIFHNGGDFRRALFRVGRRRILQESRKADASCKKRSP